MVTRKEETPQRRASRKYEEKNKEQRRAKCGNFQTMIPRELFDEVNAFLKEKGITKVELIRAGYEYLRGRSDKQ
jgi:hypothetical protein